MQACKGGEGIKSWNTCSTPEKHWKPRVPEKGISNTSWGSRTSKSIINWWRGVLLFCSSQSTGTKLQSQSNSKSMEGNSNEFTKRIDPDLQFYYHTSDKNRYRIHDIPSLDNPPDGRSRLDFLPVPRREDGADGCGQGSNASERNQNCTTAVS